MSTNSEEKKTDNTPALPDVPASKSKPKVSSKSSKKKSALVTEQLVDNIFEDLSDLDLGEPSVLNLMDLATASVELAANVKGLEGVQRKNLVIRVLNKLLDNVPDQELKVVLKSTLPLVSAAIDKMRSASKGNVKFNSGNNCLCF